MTKFLTKKRVLFLMLSVVSLASFAQDAGAGITAATGEITKVRAVMGAFILTVGAVVGFVGGLKVYIAWNSGEQQVNRLVMGWFGACIFLVSVGLVINGFFGA